MTSEEQKRPDKASPGARMMGLNWSKPVPVTGGSSGYPSSDSPFAGSSKAMNSSVNLPGSVQGASKVLTKKVHSQKPMKSLRLKMFIKISQVSQKAPPQARLSGTTVASTDRSGNDTSPVEKSQASSRPFPSPTREQSLEMAPPQPPTPSNSMPPSASLRTAADSAP